MWILSRLAVTVQQVNKSMENKELHFATRDLRKFIYNDLCDTYVEFVKPSLSNHQESDFLPSLLILHTCVITSLKMLHPIVPFITEELYQRLPTLPNEIRKNPLCKTRFHNRSHGMVFLMMILILTLILVF